MFSSSLEVELRRVVWKRRLRLMVIVAATVALPVAAFEGYREWLRFDREWLLVEQVLLYPDYTKEQGTVARWITSPTIALVNATDEDEKFVRQLVVELNDVLRRSRIAMRLSESGIGNVRVNFAPRANFVEYANMARAPHVARATGYYTIWWNDGFAITRADVFVRSDLAGDERRATIAHELAHALGLRGHSPGATDSVIFAAENRRSSAVRLAPIDRKLLRFLYMYLRPGDDWLSTRTAFRHSWGK